MTWGHALSFPSAASGNVAQVAEEEAGLRQWGNARTLCVQREIAPLAPLPGALSACLYMHMGRAGASLQRSNWLGQLLLSDEKGAKDLSTDCLQLYTVEAERSNYFI